MTLEEINEKIKASLAKFEAGEKTFQEHLDLLDACIASAQQFKAPRAK